MASCKHDIKDLIGKADGIHCKACGAVFKSMDEVKPKPKKGGKKNASK